MAITRTHFAYRIDLWTDDEKEVVEHLADVDDLTVAMATYHTAVERWPGKAITLPQGHVIQITKLSTATGTERRNGSRSNERS